MSDQQEKILHAVKNDDVLTLARMEVDPQWANSWSDENGRGLLHHAVHNRAAMAIQWMVDQWPMDPNPRDNQGETPLMRAAWLGDVQSMDTLISAGADLNAQARTGGTARHYAYSGDKPRALELLTAADPDVLDVSGRRAEEWKTEASTMKQGAELLKKIETETRRVLRIGRKI